VILRVIRGRASSAQLQALRTALRDKLGAVGREQAGPVTHHLGARRGGGDTLEWAFVGLWESPEAVTSGDAAGRTALSIATEIGLEGLDTVHFEIDEPIRGPGSGDAMAIRIACGAFSKAGADIEMLTALRTRVPLLGDEMAEAYVGRRLIGRAVEVTFVSVWRDLPGKAPLDAPFWPDMVVQYDRLAIDVYESVGTPPGIG
jgi:hypothetical protein